FAPLRIPLASNLTGELLAAGTMLDASHWRRHIREPVLFDRGLRALRADGCAIFVEIGPKATLSSIGRRALAGAEACWLPSLRSGGVEHQSMLTSAAELFVRGVRLQFD